MKKINKDYINNLVKTYYHIVKNCIIYYQLRATSMYYSIKCALQQINKTNILPYKRLAMFSCSNRIFRIITKQ